MSPSDKRNTKCNTDGGRKALRNALHVVKQRDKYGSLFFISANIKCEFVNANTRCVRCVALKTPCTPKLTAKQQADRERELSHSKWTSIGNGPVAEFQSPSRLQNGLTRATAANLEVYTLLQKRRDALDFHLRTIEGLFTGRDAHGNQSSLVVAQQETRLEENSTHGDEEYITSYPTPE
jgi:hypothetical protein